MASPSRPPLIHSSSYTSTQDREYSTPVAELSEDEQRKRRLPTFVSLSPEKSPAIKKPTTHNFVNEGPRSAKRPNVLNLKMPESSNQCSSPHMSDYATPTMNSPNPQSKFDTPTTPTTHRRPLRERLEAIAREKPLMKISSEDLYKPEGMLDAVHARKLTSNVFRRTSLNFDANLKFEVQSKGRMSDISDSVLANTFKHEYTENCKLLREIIEPILETMDEDKIDVVYENLLRIVGMHSEKATRDKAELRVRLIGVLKEKKALEQMISEVAEEEGVDLKRQFEECETRFHNEVKEFEDLEKLYLDCCRGYEEVCRQKSVNMDRLEHSKKQLQEIENECEKFKTKKTIVVASNSSLNKLQEKIRALEEKQRDWERKSGEIVDQVRIARLKQHQHQQEQLSSSKKNNTELEDLHETITKLESELTSLDSSINEESRKYSELLRKNNEFEEQIVDSNYEALKKAKYKASVQIEECDVVKDYYYDIEKAAEQAFRLDEFKFSRAARESQTSIKSIQHSLRKQLEDVQMRFDETITESESIVHEIDSHLDSPLRASTPVEALESVSHTPCMGRMRHDIPHIWEAKSGSKGKDYQCDICFLYLQKSTHFYFCTSCKLRSHDHCVAKVKNTCGLPKGLAELFTKQSSTPNSKPTAL